MGSLVRSPRSLFGILVRKKRETLYFVRSGTVGSDNGSLRHFGRAGDGWSRTGVGYASATSATAYHLNANASDVYPSYGPRNRWTGFPVRCLV